MKRQLNVRFLAGLLLGAALVSASFYGLHAIQVQRSAGSLLRQADAAQTKGDHRKALDSLERYLNYKPNDIEAKIKYGTLLAPDVDTANPGDMVRTEAILQRVLAANADRTVVRRRCVDLESRLALLVRDPDHYYYQSARSNLLVLLAPQGTSSLDDSKDVLIDQLKKAPKDAHLKWQLGQCHEGLKNYDLAEADYEAARTDDPTLIDAYVRQAFVLRMRFGGDMAKRAKADRIMDAKKPDDGVIVHNIDSARAYLARARYRLTYQDRDVPPEKVAQDAAQDTSQARKLAKLDPDKAEALLMSAEVAIKSAETRPGNRARVPQTGPRELPQKYPDVSGTLPRRDTRGPARDGPQCAR